MWRILIGSFKIPKNIWKLGELISKKIRRKIRRMTKNTVKMDTIHEWRQENDEKR